MYCGGGTCCNNKCDITHVGFEMSYNSNWLFDQIEEEMLRSSTDEDSAFDSENSFESAVKPWIANSYRLCDAPDSMPFVPFANDPKMLDKDEEDLLMTLMNPRTLEKVAAADLFKNETVVKPEPKPYHAWTHDHDYFGKRIKTESAEENSTVNNTQVSKSENEPIVEVWKIDNFPKQPQTADPGQADDVWSKFQVEVKGRRPSTRVAVLKQKMQHRRITQALRVEMSNNKPKRTRQYKNVRPKNSVETTPSQSDIEEWSSVPARPTHTKVTKKKTTKGRIDHSESERHRREVLRENFSALCELIPTKYLRGEKASSQISKQKILNGAKAFIGVLRTCKGTYRDNLVQNKHLRSRWQDRNLIRQQIEAFRKCMKKK